VGSTTRKEGYLSEYCFKLAKKGYSEELADKGVKLSTMGRDALYNQVNIKLQSKR